jgi:hypothetical protein
MNGRRARYASVAVAALLAADLAPAWAPAAPSSASAEGQAITAGAIAEAEKPGPLPTFASIPPAPTDVRPFEGWRSAILDLQRSGARVAAEASAEPWTLSDTEGWAERERSEASPPPPITTPSEGDTEAFVAAMRARATPPPRAHPAEASKKPART